MSSPQVPAPDFDETRYERPNKDWICGRSAEGCPCRIGPGPQGQCRATTECKPLLVRREGEAKGTWQCTRPKDWGGACAAGPLPSGACCRAIPKCRPERSLRNRRGLVTRTVIAASVGGLLIALAGPWRESFINPAPLSQHHAGVEFENMAAGRAGPAGQGCVACHGESQQGFTAWTATAIKVGGHSLDWRKLLAAETKDFSRMDASCLSCHQAQGFHVANVARETSCSLCHREHRGGGPLPAVAAGHCTDCHGSTGAMLASAEKARHQPAALFAKAGLPGLLAFPDQRPAGGFTQPITSFAGDHPEFRVNRPDSRRDGNTLAFNHAVHLAGNIPPRGGESLDCASCHRPDASGAFMQRVSFEQNCRSCHALQFDERNPDMELPHGDATYVRAFLRSLPAQYADHAARRLRLGPNEIARYVEEQMKQLRDRTPTGEQLEAQVFFSDAKDGPVPALAGQAGTGRARFAGCATCHEITPRPNAAPYVTPPVLPDRWLPRAQFNHGKHGQMTCISCHATAAKSELTSDILMPTQQSCAQCHSPKGGISDSCMKCHNYHNPPPAGWTQSLLR